jgi:hypothetical protein
VSFINSARGWQDEDCDANEEVLKVRTSEQRCPSAPCNHFHQGEAERIIMAFQMATMYLKNHNNSS